MEICPRGPRLICGWTNPDELRVAAIQAIAKIDPDWVREFFPNSGLDREEMTLGPLDASATSKFVRQRRHKRVRLVKSVPAVSTNLKQNCRLDIKMASLAGGLATTNMHLAPGTQVQLRIQAGLRSVHATALMRDYRSQDMSFEIVDIGLDERNKFRKLLLDNMAK